MDVYVEPMHGTAQYAASEPGGMVRAVVDGTGRLVNLSVEPALLRPAEDGDWTSLAAAIERATLAAVAHAQRTADAHRAPAAASAPAASAPAPAEGPGDGPGGESGTQGLPPVPAPAPVARGVARVAVPYGPPPGDPPSGTAPGSRWVALAPRRKR